MLEQIKKIIKGNETKGKKVEEFDCKLNPFLRNYYEGIKLEEIKVTIKGIKNTIYTNKLYIGFLKNKIREGRRHYDIEIASMYECLLTREILDKEYMNNTLTEEIDEILANIQEDIGKIIEFKAEKVTESETDSVRSLR